MISNLYGPMAKLAERGGLKIHCPKGRARSTRARATSALSTERIKGA